MPNTPKASLIPIPLQREQIDATLAAMRQQMHDLHANVQAAVQGDGVGAASLMAWMMFNLHRQHLATLETDLKKGADFMTRMLNAGALAKETRHSMAEARHTYWLTEARICRDTNPAWSNWKIACHLARQLRRPHAVIAGEDERALLQYAASAKTIYRVLQRHLPRR